MIACNFSDQNAVFPIPEDFAQAECLISTYGKTEYTGSVSLRPFEAFVLQK